MRLVEFVPPVPHPLWRLCPQMGITDVVVKVNPELTGLADPWRFETLSAIVSRLAEAGLRVVGLEGDPFDMSPIKEHGANGVFSAETQKGREEALAHYRELLESMGRLGIKLLCYNFMVGKGWSRTGVREGRGGAKATYFSLDETEKERTSDFGRQTSVMEVRSLRSEVLYPIASGPRSPVRIRMHSSIGRMKILPSPMSPVRAPSMMASIVFST